MKPAKHVSMIRSFHLAAILIWFGVIQIGPGQITRSC